MLFSHDEYLEFKEYVDRRIVEQYNDIWIKKYIGKYLEDNKLELKDIKTYADKCKLNKYLLNLYENNLLNELEVQINMYKHANKHFYYGNCMTTICEKLSNIPDRY